MKIDRQVPRKPRLVGGVKGHNINEISFPHFPLATTCPGTPALWAGSFTILITSPWFSSRGITFLEEIF
jgi:hypothetical protein